MKTNSKKPGRFSLEKLVSYAAILVGLSALTVSLYEANIYRKQQKAAVWPYLELTYGFDRSGIFTYIIHNKGMGPAIIEWTKITIDDKPINSWTKYIKEIINSDPVNFSTSFIYNKVVSPDERVQMIIIRDEQAAYKAYENRNRIKIEICYRSIFDDYWLLKRDSTGRSHNKIKFYNIPLDNEFKD